MMIAVVPFHVISPRKATMWVMLAAIGWAMPLLGLGFVLAVTGHFTHKGRSFLFRDEA
jgi:hypothetical protein